MFRNLFFAAVLVIFFISCKSKSAYNYSEEMVAKETSLTSALSGTEDKMGQFITNQQYDSVAATAASMEKTVQKLIDEIDAKPAPKVKEADNFKAGMLRYFSYIKSLYTGYKKFGKAATEEEREQVRIEQLKLVDEKSSVLNEIQRVQKKYAEANGFKVR